MLAVSLTLECGSDQYRCRDGRCIHKSRVCDGLRDCPEGEDERRCGR